LCSQHFQKPTAGITSSLFVAGRDGWCRHCHGIQNTAAFQKPREAAARLILKTLLRGKKDISLDEYSAWTEEKIETTIMPKQGAPNKEICDLAEEFGIFIYSLTTCGLSTLAGRLMRVTMLIAKVMRAHGISMLLPQQVFYMLSSDPSKLACGRSLADVLSACGSDILSQEEVRRKEPDAVTFEQFDSAAVRQNTRLRVALLVFDGTMNAPTHDLIYGTAMWYAKDTTMITTLVVRTPLTREQLDAGKEPPYEQNIPSVLLLIAAFGENVKYICSDDSNERVVTILRGLRLNVMVHISGYNYQHFWKALVMARVAEFYVEWLSLASLLLCWMLCGWTISSRELLTQEQLEHPDREAIL
jgi:hypothetical protein